MVLTSIYFCNDYIDVLFFTVFNIYMYYVVL